MNLRYGLFALGMFSLAACSLSGNGASNNNPLAGVTIAVADGASHSDAGSDADAVSGAGRDRGAQRHHICKRRFHRRLDCLQHPARPAGRLNGNAVPGGPRRQHRRRDR